MTIDSTTIINTMYSKSMYVMYSLFFLVRMLKLIIFSNMTRTEPVKLN